MGRSCDLPGEVDDAVGDHHLAHPAIRCDALNFFWHYSLGYLVDLRQTVLNL